MGAALIQCVWDGEAFSNARDASERGRFPVGERSHMARLTEEKVRAIREKQGTGASLAKEFGVSRPTIRRIKSGKGWRHVE